MKKLYIVIHCIDPYEQGGVGHAIKNAHIAYDNGADGIFLIGHRLQYLDLIQIYYAVRKQFPDEWIGVNFLDVPTTKLELLNPCQDLLTGLNALWFDSLPVGKTFSVETFGGIAFKYINPNPTDEDLARECRQAILSVSTATTSGNKTGEPPSIEKLQKIKKLLEGKIPLAVASGVTAENISSMLPYVDSFLVATSVTARDPSLGDNEYLVPEKVKELADVIRASDA